MKKLRVVQWTSGSVARQCVRAIVAHPDLELVGMYAWSKDKVGRDAGELCGMPALGVLATDVVDALLALKPDCVCYNALWPSVEDFEKSSLPASTSSPPRCSSPAGRSPPSKPVVFPTRFRASRRPRAVAMPPFLAAA
ncbi:MAG: hypothetical protein IPG64_11375 [Haliea sp.]|nr:hypothetical protein [Haliea sp.]